MASRISYNVHGNTQLDRSRLIDHYMALSPVAVVVMNNIGLAKDLKDMSPSTNVIYRHWPDGNLHNELQPGEWLNRQLQLSGNDRTLTYYTTNEPGLSQRVIDWHVQLIEEANRRGVSLCVLNLAVGNPEPGDWPRALPLLKLLAQQRQHVLGLHEYFGAVPTSGLYGGYPDNAGVYPGKPGGQNLVATWPKDVAGVTRYHLGRFKFLTDYCKSIGLQPPRIILTEHGADETSDIKPWLERLIKTPPYPTIRGWKTLHNQWALWYMHLGSPEDIYFEMFQWANEKLYINSPVEAQCIFCWGHSSAEWEQFNVANAGVFQRRLEQYAAQGKPPAPIPPTPVPIPTPGLDTALLADIAKHLDLAGQHLDLAGEKLNQLFKEK